MAKDDLGNRMKRQYENRTRYMLPRRTYTIIRLDGKSFHTFTRGMQKPFDTDLINMMDETAKFLCKEIQGAKLAYVQSDEISILLTDFETITTDAWFDGNIQKIVSVSASLATSKFNQLILSKYIKSTFDDGVKDITYRFMDLFDEVKLANFDSRVFTIPDPIEVENYFIWRQKDAVRNSLSMLAQSLYSHKELHGKSQANMHDMIHAKGYNWNNVDDRIKRGRTIYYEVIDVSNEEVYGGRGGWKISTPDFLKEREILSNMIPKIT